MAFQYIMPTPVDMSDVFARFGQARQRRREEEQRRSEFLLKQEASNRDQARLDEQIRRQQASEDRQTGLDTANAIPKIKDMLTPGHPSYDPESGMSLARAYGINLSEQKPPSPGQAPSVPERAPTEYGPRETPEIARQAGLIRAAQNVPGDADPAMGAAEDKRQMDLAESERQRFAGANETDQEFAGRQGQFQGQQAAYQSALHRAPTYSGTSRIGPVNFDPNAAMATREEQLRQQQQRLSPLEGAVDRDFQPVVHAMVQAGMPPADIAKAVGDYRKQMASDSRDTQYKPSVSKQDEWHRMMYRAAMANAGAKRQAAGDDDPAVGGSVAQYLTDNPGDIPGAYAVAGRAGSRAPTKTVGAVVTQTKPTESQQKAAEQAAQGLRAVESIDKLGYKPSDQDIQQWLDNQRSVNRADEMSKNSTFGSLAASGGQYLGALKRSEFDGMSPKAAEYFTNVRRMMEPLARKQSGAAISESEWKNFFNQYGPMSPGGAAAARRDLSDLARGGGAATRQLDSSRDNPISRSRNGDKKPPEKSNPIIESRSRPSLDDLAEEHGL